MYTQILRHSIIGDNNTDEHEELLERFRKSVESIVIMFDVMTTQNLALLIHLLALNVKLSLNSLRSLLHVPENKDQPIRTLHPSFQDFLWHQERCVDKWFWINEADTHIDMF